MTRIQSTLNARAPGRSARPRYLAVPLLALLLAGGGIALAVQAAVRPAPREVALVARDMSFYLPGDPTPNPRLVVERGEAVRLVLRNEDRGMVHDVAVPDGDGAPRAMRPLRGAGESARLDFRAPEVEGEYEYVCTFHSRMMRGVLEVR